MKKETNLNIRVSNETMDKINILVEAMCLNKTAIITNMIEDLYDLFDELTLDAVKCITFNYKTEPTTDDGTLDKLIDYYVQTNHYPYSTIYLKAICESVLEGSNIFKERLDREALAYTE